MTIHSAAFSFEAALSANILKRRHGPGRVSTPYALHLPGLRASALVRELRRAFTLAGFEIF